MNTPRTSPRGTITRLALLVALVSPPAWSAGKAAPLGSMEAQALRILAAYKNSLARQKQLENDAANVRQMIKEVAPASTEVAIALAPEDIALMGRVNGEVEREKAWRKSLLEFWLKNRPVADGSQRSFKWRFGDLTDNLTELDAVERNIRSFPFDNSKAAGEPPKTTPAAGSPSTGGANTQAGPGSSVFDGSWTVFRKHTGCCAYSANSTLTISTDAAGKTHITGDSSGMGDFIGTVTGNVFAFSGPGTGSVTRSEDGRTFSGNVVNKAAGHQFTLTGTRR